MTELEMNPQQKSETSAPVRQDPGRPLVTFALFAYNQERYIREAIEGVFSQTYEPLEIILSDDCSTDRTFEIMGEMAATYCGPHRVRVNQTPKNNGFLCHFLNVARQAKGLLVVVAAGDDLSYPERTSTLVSEWTESQPACIYSAYDEIDADSKLTISNVRPGRTGMRIWNYFLDSQPRDFCYGMSAAYSSRFLSALPDTDLKILHEDMVTTVMCYALSEKIQFVDQSLMKYRIHQSVQHSNFDPHEWSGLIGTLGKHRLHAESYMNIVKYVRSATNLRSARNSDILLNTGRLNTEERSHYLEWKSLSPITTERIELLRMIRSMSDVKLIFPRIFGVSFYAFTKLILLKYKNWLAYINKLPNIRN